MKKNIKIFVIIGTLFAMPAAKGQVPDIESPLIKFYSAGKDLKMTAGARMIGDLAYFRTDKTAMKSGAAITDARIRASLTYRKFYIYADFDFAGGHFTQRDFYLRYSLCETSRGIHVLKGGYYAEPFSMNQETSRYALHFISRPAPVMALSPGRALGLTYRYFNTRTTLSQGVFAENRYNNQDAGSQGVTVAGRWIWKAVNNAATTFHIGVSARYARMNTGAIENGIFTTKQILSSTMQTAVDPTTQFLNAELPWARENINLGGELLYRVDRFFARGEYVFKQINKERPDNLIFTSQLGDVWSWTTIESWRNGNPLGSSKFDGGYIELGYLLKGNRYQYNDEMAQLGGMMDDDSWEVVARYSYTNLNDIRSGEYFLYGRKQFYPDGIIQDYPATSKSVGGGKMHAFNIGLNYSMNAYLKILAEYQFARLDNVYFPLDKNFHTLQLRVMFSF